MISETQVVCPVCKACTAARVNRRGFLQQRLMPLLGYYPWKCGECGCTFLCRSRRRADQQSKARSHGASTAE